MRHKRSLAFEVETATRLLVFPPTWMRRMARSVSRAMADGWSVSARVRGNVGARLTCAGNCRHERPEFDTARADAWPCRQAFTGIQYALPNSGGSFF